MKPTPSIDVSCRDGGCPGNLWTGHEHYMWVDLTAGPVYFGDHEFVDGLVAPWSFPNVTEWAKKRDKV